MDPQRIDRAVFVLTVVGLMEGGCSMSRADPVTGAVRATLPPAPVERGTSVRALEAAAVPTKLPRLPELTGVAATGNDDSAHVVFDPFPGAKDYRIYELPADRALTLEKDGNFRISNGLYRCAGARFAPYLTLDDAPQVQSGAFRSQVIGNVNGVNRVLADATLGHV